QDDITTAIVTAILPAVADAELRRVLRKPPESLGAWEAYQRGLWHIGKADAEEVSRAQEFFQQAIGLDVAFAPPYSAMAMAHILTAASYAMQSFEEAGKLATAWVRRAVQFDENDANAQISLAAVAVISGNRVAGQEHIMLALSLS